VLGYDSGSLVEAALAVGQTAEVLDTLVAMRATRGDRRWRWFVAWMLPGVCLAFGVTALGIFVVPVGLLLIVGLSWRRATVDALGLLAGLSAIVAWMGSINLGYRACTSNHVALRLSPGGPRSVSYSCGGINGLTWMIVGIGAAVAAVVLYLVMTRHRGLPGGKPTSAPLLSD